MAGSEGGAWGHGRDVAWMKALRLYGVRDLRLEEIPRPERAKDEVLLEVKASGISLSDVKSVYETGVGTEPQILGHEFAGRIVEAEDIALIGRAAAAYPMLFCGRCMACLDGRPRDCGEMQLYGRERTGGMAEFVTVKKQNLVFLPPDVSFRAAALTGSAAVALHAFRKTGVGPGSTLVVFGLGAIGLTLASWAREADVRNIVLVAHAMEKAMFARSLGFLQSVDIESTDVYNYVMRLTGGRGADACVEGLGEGGALETALLAVKRGGRVVLMGKPEKSLEMTGLMYDLLLQKEIELHGAWKSSLNTRPAEWLDAMNAMRSHAVDAEALVTQTFRFEEYEEAFSLIHEKKEMHCKVLFVNGEEAHG